MRDILKTIINEGALGGRGEERLFDLDVEWNETIAARRAREIGVTLGAEHWEVIRALRDHYRTHGAEGSARTLLQALESRFADKGGRKYLFSLFPGGPVRQGSMIAGLPVPPGASDPSFGYVE